MTKAMLGSSGIASSLYTALLVGGMGGRGILKLSAFAFDFTLEQQSLTNEFMFLSVLIHICCALYPAFHPNLWLECV